MQLILHADGLTDTQKWYLNKHMRKGGYKLSSLLTPMIMHLVFLAVIAVVTAHAVAPARVPGYLYNVGQLGVMAYALLVTMDLVARIGRMFVICTPCPHYSEDVEVAKIPKIHEALGTVLPFYRQDTTWLFFYIFERVTCVLMLVALAMDGSFLSLIGLLGLSTVRWLTDQATLGVVYWTVQKLTDEQIYALVPIEVRELTPNVRGDAGHGRDHRGPWAGDQ